MKCVTVVLLFFSEKFELLLGPSDPVVVVAGDDVVLPCFLKPSISAVDMEVRWFRKDFTEYVYLYQNAQTITTNQIPSYKERAALFPEELTKGNVSLKLTGVKSSDGGRYKCFVQSTESHDDWSIDVIIMGTKSLISIERYRDRGISFKYELKTWYPDAEVTWLDSEGQNLTAEYSETHRSTDGSLSLRGRVIVQERHRNRFTSRVLQKQLGLLREEVVEIPAQLLEMDAHLLEMDGRFCMCLCICMCLYICGYFSTGFTIIASCQRRRVGYRLQGHAPTNTAGVCRNLVLLIYCQLSFQQHETSNMESELFF
uniref:Ig-like domain-containing protein n=1 Tax=Paramormyrops kingsleyae TaxID=1676925 RepID=A0A3B3QJT8_9TELE